MDERPCIGSPPRLLGAGSLLSSATEAYEQAYQKTLRDESNRDSGLLLSLPATLDIAPVSSKFGDVAQFPSKPGPGDVRDCLPRGALFSSEGLRRSGSATDATPHFGATSGFCYSDHSRALPSSTKPSSTIQLAPGDRVEVTLKSPMAHRNVELVPGEKLEISSPRPSASSAWLNQSLEAGKCSSREFLSGRQGGAPLHTGTPCTTSFSPAALSSSVNAPVASSHLERENERQRMEILSLKQENETLLRTNSMLQAQFEVEKRNRSFAGSEAADAEARVAWLEERRGLEKEIMQLQEKCRKMEMEKLAASTSRQDLCGPALREPDFAQKRRLEDAEQRVHQLEDQLVRCQAQCEDLRKRTIPDMERSKSEEHRKAEDLKQQVDHLRATNDEHEKTLHECNDRVLQGQRDLQGIRSDYDILVRNNEVLKQENARFKEDAQSANEKARALEIETSSLRTRFTLQEKELSTKVEQLASIAHSSTKELENNRLEHEGSEKELSQWKTECLELKSQLAKVRTEHDDLKSRSESREGHLRQEMLTWKQKHENLMAEKELVGAQLDGSLQEKQALQAQNQDYLKQCEEASKALMEERKRTQDISSRTKNVVTEMDRRGQVLMRQLDDEKQRNVDLTRELSAACEAARIVQVHPRTRTKSPSKYQAEAHTSEKGLRLEKAEAKGKSGWSAVMTRMQKELDELQRWKGSAMATAQKSQGTMEEMQSKYKRQLQYNRQLQQRLEELGRHAKETVSHVEQSHSGPGHSSDDDLMGSSPSAIPKPSRMNGSMPTGTSNDLLGSDHPEDVLGAALGHSSSTAGLTAKDNGSKRHQRSIRSEPLRIPGNLDPPLCFNGPDLPEHGKFDLRAHADRSSCGIRRHDYSEFSSSTMDGDSQASSSLFDTWPSSQGVFYDTAPSMDRSGLPSFSAGRKGPKRSKSSGPSTRARRLEETPKRTTAKLMSKSSAKSL